MVGAVLRTTNLSLRGDGAETGEMGLSASLGCIDPFSRMKTTNKQTCNRNVSMLFSWMNEGILLSFSDSVVLLDPPSFGWGLRYRAHYKLESITRMKAFQELESGISTPPNAPQTHSRWGGPSPSDWVTQLS